MQISARNQLKGRVTNVVEGMVSTEVELELAGGEKIVSVITKNSAQSLGVEVGAEMIAVVKASSVMIAK